MYKVSELARRWRVDRKTVLNWIHSGRLPAIRTPGTHFRIPASAVKEWEENAPEGGIKKD